MYVLYVSMHLCIFRISILQVQLIIYYLQIISIIYTLLPIHDLKSYINYMRVFSCNFKYNAILLNRGILWLGKFSHHSDSCYKEKNIRNIIFVIK